MTLSYIIPPYLLDSTLGSELQKLLQAENEGLGLLNVISSQSPFYSSKKPVIKSDTLFSQDPYLDAIIKQKVLYKLAVIGALGDSPTEFIHDSPHLYELYTIFKSRLLDETVRPGSSVDHETLTDSTTPEQRNSLISSKVGEIDFASLPDDQLPPQYVKYLDYSLKDLILSNSYKESNMYMLPPSFVLFGAGRYFDNQLPISWIPLVQSKHLNYLNKALNLVVDIENGFSTINLSTNPATEIFEDLEELAKTRYYNFISNKPVVNSASIYYYEVEIEHEASDATNFKPIIAMNDNAVSSDSSLSFSAGFVKQFLHVDGLGSNSIAIQSKSVKELDLDKLKDDIFYSRSSVLESLFGGEVESFLSAKPGDFKGSFAVNFEDLAFYNSVKASESIQRTALLNVNRRLSSLNRASITGIDSGKIDIGIPFSTRLIHETPSKRTYKTDTIGCGINFIDKSIFITLNGVLAKVISQDELASSGSSNDLFSDSKPTDAVYPMIGFRLNEVDISSSAMDESKMKIKTNLGYKEFKFNISKYVRSYKAENQRFLYLSLLDKIQNNKILSTESEVENSLLNINDDSKMLNNLIKGYLNHEGYLETFKAFNNDLQKLSHEVNKTEELDLDNSTDLEKSHIVNRQLIKNYLYKNQFDLCLKFLGLNYPTLQSQRGSLVFEIKYLKFTFLIKNYIERKLNVNNFEFEFDEPEKELYARAYNYGHSLRQEYKEPEFIDRIDTLSAVFLVKDENGLNHLPKVRIILNDYRKSLVKLASDINISILQHLGFHKNSNLEQIFENVNNNITELSISMKDDKFMLVNFEKDHMDL